MHSQLHDRPLLSGRGWRVGLNPEAGEFCAIVGADTWALELTLSEWEDFCRAIRQIQSAIATVSEQLMEDEEVTFEQASEQLLIAATGQLSALTLYLQIQNNRRGEGYWAPEALPSLFEAIDRLQAS